MRKPTTCICKNKGADQFRSNCEAKADQHLCFSYTDNTISLLLKSEISSLCLYSSVCVRLVGKPHCWFIRVAPHIYIKSSCDICMSHLMGKPTMWFPNRFNTIRAVQAQMARRLKFRILVEAELYYPSSENKGADQLRSNCESDLRHCFAYADCWFSHVVARILHGHVFVIFY